MDPSRSAPPVLVLRGSGPPPRSRPAGFPASLPRLCPSPPSPIQPRRASLHRHPLTTASCCCRCTRTLSLAKTGGLGGRLRECVRLIRAQEPGCPAVDVCVADPCLLVARLPCPVTHPIPGGCRALQPPSTRPASSTASSVAHPNRPMACTSPPPAPPVCIFLTGAPGCPLPACCLYDKPACNHLV